MKQLRIVLGVLVLMFLVQCKTQCKIADEGTTHGVVGVEKEVDMKIIDVKGQEKHTVFYQEWIAGVQYGGSGVNLYIQASVIDQDIAVVAYFRGQQQVLEQIIYDGQEFLIGRFKTAINQPKDFVMSDNPVQEVGNADKLMDLAAGLDKNEAIITYEKSGKSYQVVFRNISEIEQLLYPSPPRPNDE